MNRFMILGLLCVIGVAVAGSAGTCFVCPELETHFEDGFTLSFSLKGLFLDTEYWNEMIPEDHFGMSGYGAKLNEVNEFGYTTWNGAMAGLTLESIWASSTEGWYGHLGGGLYCGTFNFASTGLDGTGISGCGGAFYLEPYIGVSYQISESLFIQGKISTICSLMPGNAWTDAQPDGRLARIDVVALMDSDLSRLMR